MVAGLGGEDARAVLYAAAFGVVGGENQFPDARKADGLGAHGAGFEGDVEIASHKPGGADGGGGGANGQNFGVGGGVVVGFHLVAGAGENFSGWADDDGADRDLATGGGGLGFLQGEFHPLHAIFLPAHALRV